MRKNIPIRAYSTEWYRSKNEMMTKAEEQGHRCLMSRFSFSANPNVKMWSDYGSYPTHQDFIDATHTIPIQRRPFFAELIASNNECRIYADLEWPKSSTTTEGLTKGLTEDRVIENVALALSKVLDTDLSSIKKDLRITCSSTKNKGSLHLVLINFKTSNNVAQSKLWNAVWHQLRQNKDMWVLKEEKGHHSLKSVLDCSVYSKDRVMRCLYSCKINEESGQLERPFEPYHVAESSSSEKAKSKKTKKKYLFPEDVNQLDYYITFLSGNEQSIDIPSLAAGSSGWVSDPKMMSSKTHQISKVNCGALDGDKIKEAILQQIETQLLSKPRKTTTKSSSSSTSRKSKASLLKEKQEEGGGREYNFLTQHDIDELVASIGVPDFETIGSLINRLNPSRADDTNQWLQIRYLLKDLSLQDPKNKKRYLELYCKFSNTDRYTLPDGARAKEFKQTRPEHSQACSLLTLKKWASIDTPATSSSSLPLEIFDRETIRRLYQSEYGWAQICHNAMRDDLVVTNLDKHGEGYRWHQTKRIWEKTSGDEMRQPITGILDGIVTPYIKSVEKEEEGEGDPETRKLHLKYLHNIRKMVLMVRTSEQVWKNLKVELYRPEFEKSLDQSEWLCPLQDGTCVDLRNGEARPMERDDYFSRRFNINHAMGNPNHPVVLSFVSSIMGDQQDKVEYLQMVLGYLLSGSTAERCIFFFIGAGRNGKQDHLDKIIDEHHR